MQAQQVSVQKRLVLAIALEQMLCGRGIATALTATIFSFIVTILALPKEAAIGQEPYTMAKFIVHQGTSLTK